MGDKIAEITKQIQIWNDITNSQFVIHDNPEDVSNLLDANVSIDVSCIQLLFYKYALITNYDFSKKPQLIPIFMILFKYVILEIYNLFYNLPQSQQTIDNILTQLRNDISKLLPEYNDSLGEFVTSQNQHIQANIPTDKDTLTYKEASKINTTGHNWNDSVNSINSLIGQITTASLSDTTFLQNVKEAVYYPYLHMMLIMGINSISSQENEDLLLLTYCILTFVNVLNVINKIKGVNDLSPDTSPLGIDILNNIMGLDNTAIDMDALMNLFINEIIKKKYAYSDDNPEYRKLLDVSISLFRCIFTMNLCTSTKKINDDANECQDIVDNLSQTIGNMYILLGETHKIQYKDAKKSLVNICSSSFQNINPSNSGNTNNTSPINGTTVNSDSDSDDDSINGNANGSNIGSSIGSSTSSSDSDSGSVVSNFNESDDGDNETNVNQKTTNKSINKLKEDFSASFLHLINGLMQMIEEAKNAPSVDNANNNVYNEDLDKLEFYKNENDILHGELNALQGELSALQQEYQNIDDENIRLKQAMRNSQPQSPPSTNTSQPQPSPPSSPIQNTQQIINNITDICTNITTLSNDLIIQMLNDTDISDNDKSLIRDCKTLSSLIQSELKDDVSNISDVELQELSKNLTEIYSILKDINDDSNKQNVTQNFTKLENSLGKNKQIIVRFGWSYSMGGKKSVTMRKRRKNYRRRTPTRKQKNRLHPKKYYK